MARAIDADALLKRLGDLVDWCRDIRKTGLEQAMCIIQEMPTLTPPNEPMTCDGCIYNHNRNDYCDYCIRRSHVSDYYRRPPEGKTHE